MNASGVRVVGVDGGATHTRYALAGGQGDVLARSEGGPGLLGVGEDESVADRIVEQAVKLASESSAFLPLHGLCAGLAGVAGRPEARDLVERRIGEAGVARKVRVVPDFEIAFLDAFGAAQGILIIAGTGSVAVGRRAEGHLVQVGGWGALIGDEGSSYRLGLGGLRAALRAAELRNPPTTLTVSLFKALDVQTPREVFEWSKKITKAEIAELAPRVIEEADGGDEAAAAIVSRAVEGLVQHADALAQSVPLPDSPSVALVGGLVESGGLLRSRVISALERAGYQAHQEPVVPVKGAVRMALEP